MTSGPTTLTYNSSVSLRTSTGDKHAGTLNFQNTTSRCTITRVPWDSFHSGGSDSEGSDESDELDLDPEDIPVTGFAVASNKRNQDFHELFPTVPEGDYLIEGEWCSTRRTMPCPRSSCDTGAVCISPRLPISYSRPSLLPLFQCHVVILKHACRLRVCSSAGDSDSRPAVHLGEPRLLPCEHLWVDHGRKCLLAM